MSECRECNNFEQCSNEGIANGISAEEIAELGKDVVCSQCDLVYGIKEVK